MTSRVRHNKVHIRKTHPGLYHSIMTVGIMNVALAVNFFAANPAFSPFMIPKSLIGWIFGLIGLFQFVALNVFRDLRMVRLALAVSIGWSLFWGLSNTHQFFTGDTSLQLPILYVALAILQIPLLVEAPVNPMTEKQ